MKSAINQRPQHPCWPKSQSTRTLVRNQLQIAALLMPLILIGCKARDGKDQSVGEAFQEYLRQHSSPGWRGSGWFVQYGRVDFYGPFPIEVLEANRAFPASPRDAAEIRDSLLPILTHATALPDGRIVYPQVQQRMRSVRIAHMVRSPDGEAPMPTWCGAIVHERTEIPTRNNGYVDASDTPPIYRKKSAGQQEQTPYNADGPSYWKSDGTYRYGRMPYRGEEVYTPYRDDTSTHSREDKP